uniref:Uncharacterized protein n=1 Tax=Populus davidiana TaxID=266767 RepID=A0A6M2E868_9ROSI
MDDNPLKLYDLKSYSNITRTSLNFLKPAIKKIQQALCQAETSSNRSSKITARHCNLWSQSSCTRVVMELGEQDGVAVARARRISWRWECR